MPRRSLLRSLSMLIMTVSALMLGACNLERASQRPLTPIATGSSGGRPAVAILSPADNSEIVVGSQVLVSVSASDGVGVSRVQLSANGATVKTISSESAAGDRSLTTLLDYTPRTTGAIELSVVAYRGSVASDPARITINVRQAQAQVTATLPANPGVPIINPNDPTCRVLINSGLNLREGPDITYRVLTVLASGTVVPITGRVASNQWWQVRVNTTTGWLSGQFVTLYGNCQGIPVVNAPTPPTATLAPVTATPIIIPTNTLTLSPVPPTLTPTPGTPDLIISSIIGPPTLTMGPGDSVVVANFSIQITNSGQGPAGQFNNAINVVPGTGETSLGVVSGLAAGQSTILTINVPFTAPGVYTISARTDSDSQIVELSEVNNNGQVSITVAPAP